MAVAVVWALCAGSGLGAGRWQLSSPAACACLPAPSRPPSSLLYVALPNVQAKSKMSKAEKSKTKKEKAKTFNQAPAAAGKTAKNSKRWN